MRVAFTLVASLKSHPIPYIVHYFWPQTNGEWSTIGDRLSFGKQPGSYQHGNMMPFYLHNTFQFYTSLRGPKRDEPEPREVAGLVAVLSSVQCLLEYISQCTVALEKDKSLTLMWLTRRKRRFLFTKVWNHLKILFFISLFLILSVKWEVQRHSCFHVL